MRLLSVSTQFFLCETFSVSRYPASFLLLNTRHIILITLLTLTIQEEKGAVENTFPWGLLFKTGAVLSQDKALQLSREEFGPDLIKSICAEKDFCFSFLIFVINDFSKCEVGSECFACAGSSKDPSKYLSRISYSTIRDQVIIGFFSKELISSNGFTGHHLIAALCVYLCVPVCTCVYVHTQIYDRYTQIGFYCHSRQLSSTLLRFPGHLAFACLLKWIFSPCSGLDT